VTLDVTAHETVIATIAGVEHEMGAIDVLVNNAGYGHEGTIEESTLEQYRRQFDVNVFGAVSAIQAVLPFMRARHAGHIINITSMGGMVTFPGLGVYHGSKFALEGISETLAKEVVDLGIKVTAVEPGAFRTDWAGRSMVRAEQTLSDYNPLIAPLREARVERNGKQAGDPAKAAEAIVQIVHAENPPLHLPLGPDAASFIRMKIESLQDEMAAWDSLITSTNFD
jgi:NAD(P)-dependent dehydrogenase (short-subunit alcohol dehydrogenase family)